MTLKSRKHNHFFAFSLVISLLAFPSTTTPVKFPAGMVSISGEDLPGKYAEGKIIDFAISPDNAKITVGFEVGEKDKKLDVWLVEWEIHNKKFLAKAQLPKLVPAIGSFVGLGHRTMQYTPDGSGIIFQSGHDLYVLDSATLSPRYDISDPEPANNSASETYARNFVISSDGSKLAVLSGQSYYPPMPGSIRIYNATRGEELSHWSLSVQVQSLSLSSDGKRLLVTVLNPKDPTDILLLDSTTGSEIKTFRSGFGTQQTFGAKLNAIFVDADHFVATPGGDVDAKGHYLANELKIFDSRTGEVTGKLKYDNLGPSGEIWVSSKDTTLATLNLWMSQFNRRFSFTESGARHAQFLFFHLNESSPFRVLGPLPQKNGEPPRQSGLIRFSPDLGVVGLFVNRQVTLYSTGVQGNGTT